MTKYGQVISKYRKLKDMTQSQLAELLFISPQAVSKWENNLSEPDLSTINKLSEIFDITLEQFFNEEKALIENEIDDVDDLGTCIVCLEQFVINELVSTKYDSICHKCQKELLEEEDSILNLKENKPEKATFIKLDGKLPFFIGWGLGIVVFIIFIISYFTSKESDVNFFKYMIISSLISILSITFVTQMLYDSWLRDFLFGFFGKTLNLPGLIFELSLDGIIWLIIVKLVFGLLMTIFSLLIALLGIAITTVISPISYIVDLTMKIRKGFNYESI